MAGAARARGLFITFEGGDGVGKSTQVARLAEWMRARGREVLTTREPGGAPGAEAIRELLVSGPGDRWSAMSEALLISAARADHLERTINPARARGAVVLCDRFADSTLAYQGYAAGLGAKAVTTLNALVVGADGPDLTLVLDAPPRDSLRRALGRGDPSRFEAMGETYQARVREAFLDIARAEPRRCAVIDATQDIDAVARRILAVVRERLGDA